MGQAGEAERDIVRDIYRVIKAQMAALEVALELKEWDRAEFLASVIFDAMPKLIHALKKRVEGS